MKDFPQSILDDLPKLQVKRVGDNENAFMISDQLVDYVQPNKNYQLTEDGFIPTLIPIHNMVKSKQAPKHTKLKGLWLDNVDTTISEANILGGNGRFLLPPSQEQLTIAIAQTTAENLAYYDCQLINLGDSLCFDSNAPLPAFDMTIGENYVKNYLLNENHGGGAFLEFHDRPHFHMPLNRQAKGYLIVGKKQLDGYILSAFKIPYGQAVHMLPWVVHTDAFLIGKYKVIYSVTENFSTVIVRTNDGRIAKVAVA